MVKTMALYRPVNKQTPKDAEKTHLGPGLFFQAQRDETLCLGGDVPPHLARSARSDGYGPAMAMRPGDLGTWGYGTSSDDQLWHIVCGILLMIIWESYCGDNFRKAQLSASCKQLQSPEWGSRQWKSSAVKPWNMFESTKQLSNGQSMG